MHSTEKNNGGYGGRGDSSRGETKVMTNVSWGQPWRAVKDEDSGLFIVVVLCRVAKRQRRRELK